MARLVTEREDVIPLLGEVFRRYGFEGASIARITEHTKLGKGSLYHFFPGGKEEMAVAVLCDIERWFETHIFSPLEKEAPAAAIDTMFTAVGAYFRSGQRICLVGAFALEDTRDRFSVEVKRYFTRWVCALASALQRHGFSGSTAESTAKTVLAGIQGAIILTRSLDDPQHYAEVLTRLRHLTKC